MITVKKLIKTQSYEMTIRMRAIEKICWPQLKFADYAIEKICWPIFYRIATISCKKQLTISLKIDVT